MLPVQLTELRMPVVDLPIGQNYSSRKIDHYNMNECMLRSTDMVNTTSVDQLIQLWTARYSPDLSVFPSKKGLFPIVQVMESASEAGRAQTIAQVKRSLSFNCELAVFKTYALFSNSAEHLSEVRQAARCLEQVYDKILEIYQQQPSLSDYLRFIDFSRDLFGRLVMPMLMPPAINQIAEELESALLKLQQQLLVSREPRMIGFITTQFHLSNSKILQPLTVYEQMLLQPYLKFVEEQVCMPWQRVCAAAVDYPTDSPRFILVEQLFAASHEIAKVVYHQGAQLYPNHRSRRGAIADLEVATSTIRDLNMFQCYLCLCILQGSTTVVEQELLPLCRIVLPNIGVKWDLAELMLQLLVKEIQTRIDPEQMDLLLTYTRVLQDLLIP
jgi:hypothetical protein